MTSTFTAGRENGRRRPRGYAAWRPQAATRALLDDVGEVLDRYDEHLPLTIRQVFYALVGAGKIDKTEQAYARLGEHLNRARRAELVSFDALRDDGVSVIESEHFDGIADFDDETARRARAYRRDRQAGQDQRIELWCEAAGMQPQLARVAGPFSIPVYSAGGFTSLSAVRMVADRALRNDVPTVLLHVGDFDPSGESIFAHLAEDAAAFVADDRVLATQRVEAVRVALTGAQVESFELPTAPAKRTDSRSRTWQGGTCQLEALPPDQLADLVRSAIRNFLYADIFDQVLHMESEDRAELLALPPGDGSTS